MRPRLALCAFALCAAALSALSPARASAAALRVAVLDFENASADRGLDPWGKGLQSMFITDLSEVSALQLVERSRLADVQRELKLGRSRAFDPATAARVGKLLGATHLVAGTFTVAGKQLRMDLRLFSVESGAVLLSEKSEGETDAFFEVQKDLVKRVVGAIAVRVEPKERAALMRPQTADLSAFKAYSSGVSLFDDQRYDEALAAIKEARRLDQDFKLAEVTEAEYERVVADLRTEAVALQVREQAQARRAAREESKVEAAALKRLYELAERKGDAAREERVVALGELVSWLGGSRPQPSAPPAVPDPFARSCMADAAAQSYLAEVLRPEVKAPMSPFRGSLDLLLQEGAFDGEFKKLVQQYRSAAERQAFPSPAALWNLTSRLHLSPAEHADLRDRLYRRIALRGPPAEWKVEHLMENARLYREAASFDRSTALFKQASQAASGADRDRAGVLQEVADEIELNQKLSQAQKKAATPEQVEVVERAVLSRRYELQQLGEGGRRGMRDAREFPISKDDLQLRGPVLLGKHRVWEFGRYEHALTTGPRREGIRASELRYFWEQRDPLWSENLAVFDCAPRKDFTAKLTLSFTPPADFEAKRIPPASADAVAAGIDPSRPSAGVLFGVSHPTCCEASGYAVLFKAGAVQLVQLMENPPELKAHERYARKVLDEKPMALGGNGPVKVVVKVADGGVAVEAGKSSAQLKAPADRSGFYGLYFGGHGFASASDVEFK